MRLLLSIVVPVFNAERYLASCVEMAARQGLHADEYEVVLVDDGSTDGSSALADELARDHANLRVLHQGNHGAGAARNVGLGAARGEYTYFLDADDGLEDGALAKLVGQCVDQQLDVLFFGARLMYVDDEVRRRVPLNPHYFERRQQQGVVDGETMFINQQKTSNFCAQPCMFILRTAYLRERNIRFAEGIINEDNIFALLATIRAERTNVDPYPYYGYMVHEGSVTTGNTAGFKRYDAHLWLAAAFEREHYRARLSGKDELADAIAPIARDFVNVALEAYLGMGEECPTVTTADPLMHAMVHDQFDRIRHDERELGRLRVCESEAESLRARVAEMESSTTWKVGRVVTAPLRRAKDLVMRLRHGRE